MREREAPAIITATEQKGQRGGLENPSPMREPCHYPVSNRLAAPAPLHLPIKLGGWRKGGRVGGGGQGTALTFCIFKTRSFSHFPYPSDPDVDTFLLGASSKGSVLCF